MTAFRSACPDLGAGVGLRAPHADELLATSPDVAWLELIAENYLVDGGRALRVLDAVAERYPTVVHAVGLYVGDAGGVSHAHVARVRALAQRARARWVTDHLSWGSVDGRVSHDLLPLPYTMRAVRACVEGIRRVQAALDVPFAIENVSSYAAYTASTMTEWEFVAEVAERADCGILLDINNVYVSAVNHGFDPVAYLDAIPTDRVVQIHLAGHARHGATIIDTHDHPVADPVWALYAHALRRFGPTSTLIEWDSRLPPLPTLLAEAATARRFAGAEIARAS